VNIPIVDLKAQYAALKSEIDAAIAAVISETAFIGNRSNRFVQSFEAEFAAYTGAKHAIGCANGTDSLEILLRAGGIGTGDEVLVPAVSWISTSEAVTNVGANPVFVDINPDTYTIDPQAAASKISQRTRAIIPVHLYGQPADMDAIMVLAAQHGLLVIEDCAQAHGARYKGRMVGRIGHAGSFSFFPGKNLGAYGDAGGMVTDDPTLADVARMISQHGQANAKHDHRIEGRNSRMDGLQAAILSVKLPHLDSWTQARREHAARYREILAPSGLRLQQEPADCRHVYHLFVVRVKDRERVARELDVRGIATAVQYPRALPFLTAYQNLKATEADYPCAAALCKECLSLPMYPELGADVVARICRELQQVLASGVSP
jgi:dTDP-4-amino-4,6-dideoxygalactose transaminase